MKVNKYQQGKRRMMDMANLSIKSEDQEYGSGRSEKRYGGRSEVYGRAWHRAEDRMHHRRRGVRESPKKGGRYEQDLRNKLKRSLKSYDPVADSDKVEFKKPIMDEETDPDVLTRREKQLAYGKNTVDYDRYTDLVDKMARADTMPRTPNKHKKYSRRQWDGMVKKWKQQIHTTVAILEGKEPIDDEEGEIDWREDGRLSATGSWAEEVEEDEKFRCRTMSSASSDQGLGHSSMSSSGEDTPTCESPSPRDSVVMFDKDNVFQGHSQEDFIDAY